MQRATESIGGTRSSDMPTVPAKAQREEAVNPRDIGLKSTMAEVLRAYPGAKIGCSFGTTSEGVPVAAISSMTRCRRSGGNYSIADPLETVLAFIRQSASVEAKIHVSPKQVVGAIERGEDLRLLVNRMSPSAYRVLGQARPTLAVA